MTERRILTEPSGRKVVVTGARGFVGTPVVEALLLGGWEVHALASSEPTRRSPGALWHTADLLRSGEAEEVIRRVGASHLVHLAWAPRSGIYQSLDNFRWVEASLRLLRAFSQSGGRRAVFVGSCAEYDWTGDRALSETSPLGHATAYGAAKAAMSRLFGDFCTFGSLSGAWARLFFLFGPDESPERLVASVISSLLHGEPARCTHGEQLRDYLYVRDAAAALVALLEGDLEGPVNVASGEATRIRDLVAAIASRLGGEELVELGAVPAPDHDPERVVADVSRLRRELGWRPEVGLEKGIEETIDWWTRRLTH